MLEVEVEGTRIMGMLIVVVHKVVGEEKPWGPVSASLANFEHHN